MVHPSNCIACIAVSRMMMNIQRLSVDGPEDTQHETIRFRQPHINSMQDEFKSAELI